MLLTPARMNMNLMMHNKKTRKNIKNILINDNTYIIIGLMEQRYFNNRKGFRHVE